MKRVLLVTLAILGMAVAAKASCGFTHQCPLDGQTMLLEETYYNGLHQSQKWGHSALNGEHHSFVYQCN